MIAGALCALVASFALNNQSLANLRHHLGIYDRQAEEKRVEETLKKFNIHFASFFNTAGLLVGLNEFPADNLVKRRIFQDINTLKAFNNVMVYDRDVFKLKKVDFPDPIRAVALADEVWFISLQDAVTRANVSGVKANQIQVKYMLRKENGAWRVIDYQVFAKDDAISELVHKEF
ncbi:MAG: hypothetical protein HYS23_14640 [Geobacter sp.]|nr:hypothetical protein [Geobacter sp.]